jgi:hypothetical protein
MASTRNKNLLNNYCYERNYILQQAQHPLYQHSSSGQPYHAPMIPTGGTVIPSKMSRDVWTTNSIDVESMLKGINSNNLVNPRESSIHYTPQMKTPPQMLAFFEPTPVIIPKPLICPLNQRALPTT